ncbi:MAG: 30S ribosomal protein S15 [Candidatus Woesearchaeota archaeon]
MARMYSGKKGKSGSTKPSKKSIPSWIRYKPKEIEMLLIKLSKEGKSSSEIGIILRDSYGIPSVKDIAGKGITEMLKEKGLSAKIPEDLLSLIKKVIEVKKHIERNKQDQTANRGLQLTESKIKRLVKYYKRSKKLPQDWKYDEQSIRLYA